MATFAVLVLAMKAATEPFDASSFGPSERVQKACHYIGPWMFAGYAIWVLNGGQPISGFR